jgi:hypothetical protein
MSTGSPSLLAGVDWMVIAYAAGMATLMSVLVTLRARNLQQAAGNPLSSWVSVIPDTLLGGLIGVMFALLIPEFVKALKTFAGVTLLAGVGGVLGPRVTDWVGLHGMETVLDWAASGAGKFSEAVAKRRSVEGGGNDAKSDNDTDPA